MTLGVDDALGVGVSRITFVMGGVGLGVDVIVG